MATQHRRRKLTWKELLAWYEQPDLTHEEALGLIHASRFATVPSSLRRNDHNARALQEVERVRTAVTFLARVGNESVIVEPDDDIRGLARRILYKDFVADYDLLWHDFAPGVGEEIRRIITSIVHEILHFLFLSDCKPRDGQEYDQRKQCVCRFIQSSATHEVADRELLLRVTVRTRMFHTLDSADYDAVPHLYNWIRAQRARLGANGGPGDLEYQYHRDEKQHRRALRKHDTMMRWQRDCTRILQIADAGGYGTEQATDALLRVLAHFTSRCVPCPRDSAAHAAAA